MDINEVPLTSGGQQFAVNFGGTTYKLRVIWRDIAGWIMDIWAGDGTPLLMGAPLIPGVNLLEQYPHFGINGVLMITADKGAPEYPTRGSLGYQHHLNFIQG